MLTQGLQSLSSMIPQSMLRDQPSRRRTLMLEKPFDLDHMREVIDACAAFVNVAGSAGFVTRSAERTLTRFEQRGQRLGHDVWDLEYRRVN